MRLFGSFINPNFFPGYLAIALPVTVAAYMVARRGVLALAAGLAFVVEMMALMLTGAKFGIIAAVAGLVVFFLLAIATKSLIRARFQRLLILAIVALPLLVVFSGPVTSRINAAEEGGSQVHSTAFRVLTWKGTAKMIEAHPLCGVGPGAFEIAYPRYAIAGPTKYAHQSYLQIASESGIPAAAAFLAVLITLAFSAITGAFRARGESNLAKSRPAPEEASPAISWKDMVPYSGWRIVNCSICGGLAASAVHNLADSDWYTIGVAAPVAILTGVMIAQTRGEKPHLDLSRWARRAAAIACVVFIILSVSFGLGDWFASEVSMKSLANGLAASLGLGDWFASRASGGDALDSYTLASWVSPLNPLYHRELGKILAATDTDQTRRRHARYRHRHSACS